MKTTIRLLIVALAFLCLSLVGPEAQAVVPPPDGGYPGFNTAEGQNALLSLTTGVANTAVGWSSLSSVTDVSFNTGVGAGTLLFNNAGQNTAVGAAALLFNTGGNGNTANGAVALLNNVGGSFNTADGNEALLNNTTGNSNTAIGFRALYNNMTGGVNTAIGSLAGLDITGNGNVCIGQNVSGAAGVNDTTWIRNVYASVATGRAVYVNDDNKVGTLASSRRYKDEIRPMASASETILSLRPVSFRYKKEVDPTRALSFGLIAEEVAEIDPDLVTSDREGKPQTVRYEAVNAMLLNEFLKEHRKVEKLAATVADLAAELRQVKAQVHMNSSVAKVANK
jgi:hypothetical protein